MELSRRDAAAALAALGIGGAAGGAALLDRPTASKSGVATAEIRDTMIAVATVVYPSPLSGIEPFVETWLAGRLDRSNHAVGLSETIAELNELAVEWHGDRMPALDQSTREEFLREVGADTAEEVPDGTTAERVRYYVVNDLLLALYTSPTGGELVGIENPQGHPGGTASYQRGPQA